MMRLILALLSILVAACTTTPNAPAPGATGLDAVAGNWKFSHAGPSPVQQEGQPDPSKLTEQSLKGTKLTIDATGEASMVALGQSGSFQVEALEETPLYIKVGSPKEPQKAMTYDKKTGLLIWPIDVDDGQGTMAGYFRRTR